MALHPAIYSTRSLTFVVLAAIAGIGLWLLAPMSFGDGAGTDSGGGNSLGLPASLRVDGTVQSESAPDGSISRIVIPVTVRGGEGIVLTEDGKIRVETFMSESAAAAVPATYTVAWDGDDNGDTMLDPGERAIITIDLPTPSSVTADNPARVVIRTPDGASLVIEDVLP
jgi:hypothetical protein